MTPEERAVIQAAIAWWESSDRNNLQNPALYEAVRDLEYRCADCSSGGHQCPGDGKSIPHGASDCGEHDAEITDEQKNLATYLADYALGVTDEWMRIVEIDGDVTESGSGTSQARVNWEGAGYFTLGSERYAEDMGRYRLTTHVIPLPTPIIGPENNPALIEEMKEPEDLCSNCAPLLAGVSLTRVDGTEDNTNCASCGYPGTSVQEWILTDWIHVLPGDTIRMPGKTQEATVQSLHIGEWHANVESRLMDSGRWWDNVTAWDHKEISVRLTHMPERLLPFRTDAPIEILMNEERKAILVLQGAFPGSTIVQS